jgi:pseudaminic acid biosynthesis-associated methylase
MDAKRVEPAEITTIRTGSLQSGPEFWAGKFGDEYNRRNQVNWRARIPFWSKTLRSIGARSVFEMGANAGWNLSAIKATCPQVCVYGNDINTNACAQAAEAGILVENRLNFLADGRKAELVFTAGVLIHIEPENIDEVMGALIEKSYRWVLAVEYEAETETMLEYRGNSNRLWKRPYGALYERLGLRVLERIPAAPGFDDCTAWLMEK